MQGEKTTIPEPPPAIVEASSHMANFWKFGYQDGLEEISADVGERALSAITLEVQDHEGELKASEITQGQLRNELAEANDNLLPSYGKQIVGRFPRVMAWVYLGLAVVAVFAELPLSGLTIAESIGHITKDQMAFLQSTATYSLTLMLCLTGFSLKLAYDAFEGRKKGAWLVPVLAICAFLLCSISIVDVAQLREAISKEQSALAESSGAENADRNGSEQAALTAEAEMSRWAGSTFRWLTIALPWFSGACIIVCLQQLRNFRRHDHALTVLSRVSPDLSSAERAQARLRLTLQKEEFAHQASNGSETDFRGRAIAVYRHGFEAGQAELMRRPEYRQPFDRALKRLAQGGAL